MKVIRTNLFAPVEQEKKMNNCPDYVNSDVLFKL